MLAQMGGPVAFGVLWSLVTLPMLLLVILINRRNGWFSGMISGVTFALPVVLFCFGLPTTDPFIKEHYEREIYLFMVLTPVLTVGLLVWCSMVRALLCDKATGPSK